MGHMNLLKANWTGKVGQTVGAKWKGLSTIRVYTKPAYTNTPAQEVVRSVFASLTQLFTPFMAQLKHLSAMSTKNMSLRNALIRANKAQIQNGTFDIQTVIFSRGGLPNISAFTVGTVTPGSQRTLTWTPPAAGLYTSNAQVVAIMRNEDAINMGVESANVSTGLITFGDYSRVAGNVDIWAYVLDFHGSSKIASNSVHIV